MIKKLKKEQLLIGVLFGILLLVIAIPVQEEGEKKESPEEITVTPQIEKEETLEIQLENVLQRIAGVGEVKVLITYQDGGRSSLKRMKVFPKNRCRRLTAAAEQERPLQNVMSSKPFIQKMNLRM